MQVLKMVSTVAQGAVQAGIIPWNVYKLEARFLDTLMVAARSAHQEEVESS